jgi:hypothetical protein
VYSPPPSHSLSARSFARIRWLKHLVLQYVRKYMYSTDTSFFFFFLFFLASSSAFLFLRTGICRMSMFYSVVFIHNCTYPIFAGCLVRNKATLVMHLGMIIY